ncbi:prepilin-type N-terminal cleavage/methylation domain-containing protein [Bordetella sp. 2513F-2]
MRPATRRHGGFALIELSIALLIATLLLVWGTAALMRRADDAQARAAGAWLLELRHAMARMMERHFDSLAAGEPPRGADGGMLYADPMAPTVAELKAQGLLPSGFPDEGPAGAATLRLWRSGACPDDTCRLDGLAYLRAAWTHADGSPDLMRLAAFAEAAAGHGGHATAGPQDRLRGPAFDFPNPAAPGMARLAAGTPMVWAGHDLATASRYVRRQDGRDPLLRGPLTVNGTVSAAGRVRVGEYLELIGHANPGAGCDSVGEISRTPDGRLVSCREGRWTESDSGFGGAYATNNRYGCGHWTGQSTANPRTGDCSCPAGFQPVIVSAGGKWTETEGWTTGYVCVR